MTTSNIFKSQYMEDLIRREDIPLTCKMDIISYGQARGFNGCERCEHFVDNICKVMEATNENI